GAGPRPEVGDRQPAQVHPGNYLTSPAPEDGPGEWLASPAPEVGPGAWCTACPPNCARSAATAFIAGDWSWRDTNRANRAAEITGAGTRLLMASSTVQRPSPESST